MRKLLVSALAVAAVFVFTVGTASATSLDTLIASSDSVEKDMGDISDAANAGDKAGLADACQNLVYDALDASTLIRPHRVPKSAWSEFHQASLLEVRSGQACLAAVNRLGTPTADRLFTKSAHLADLATDHTVKATRILERLSSE